MEMRNYEQNTSTPAISDTDNFRVRVVSRSFVPALFECCGCYVPVTRLGLICFDEELKLSPTCSDDVIEIELINGKLRHISQSSICRPSSTGSNERQLLDESLCHRRRQLESLPEPMAEREWAPFIRPARDCSEQNVELIFDDCTRSSNPIIGRTKDIGDHCATTAADFRCPVRLRTTREVRPGDELTIWYGDQLGRLMGVPSLSSFNIRGAQCYACSFCSLSFLHPNPLKSHMMYNCPASAVNQSATLSSRAFSWSEKSSRDQLLMPLQSGRIDIPSSTNRSRSTDDNSATNREYLQHEDSLHADAVRAADVIARRHGDWRRAPEVGPMDPTLSSSTPGIDDCRRWLAGRLFGDQATRSGGNVGHHVSQQVPVWRNFEDEVLPLLLDTSRDLDYHSASAKDCGGFSSSDVCMKLFSTETHAYPVNAINWSHFSQSIRQISDGESIRQKEPPTHRPTMDRVWTQNRSSKPHDAFPARDGIDNSPSEEEESRLESRYPNSWQKSDNVAETLRRSSTSSFSPSSTTCSSSSPTTQSVEHHASSADYRSGTHGQQQKQQQQQQGAMIHKCVHCGKVYSRRYGLTIHLRTHSGDKPLECPVCRRPFGDPSNLNKHVRLHAAAVASSSMSSSALAFENGGSHGALAALQAVRDSPYRCNHCGKVLVRRRDLERHIRSRHPGLVAIGERCRTVVVT